MIQVWCSFLFLILSFFCLIEPGSAEVPADASRAVEVVIGGKTYASLHAYKLAWLKEYLQKELSPGVLRQFEPQEVCDVLEQLRQQLPQEDSSGGRPEDFDGKERSAETEAREMEEMLQDYLKEHQGTPPPALDTGKMKTIIIDPTPAPKE